MKNGRRHNQKEVTNPILVQINKIVEEHEDGSVADFCSKIGVNVANYYMWVKRNGAPSAEIIERISNIYGVSVGWFSGDIDVVQDKNQKEEDDVDIDNAPKQSAAFYLRLCELCDKRGLTPDDMVRELEWARSLPKYYSEGKIPTKRKIAEMANFFNVEPSYFTGCERSTTTYDAEKVKSFFMSLGRAREQLRNILLPIAQNIAWASEKYVKFCSELGDKIQGPATELLGAMTTVGKKLEPLLRDIVKDCDTAANATSGIVVPPVEPTLTRLDIENKHGENKDVSATVTVDAKDLMDLAKSAQRLAERTQEHAERITADMQNNINNIIKMVDLWRVEQLDLFTNLTKEVTRQQSA